MDCSFFSSLFFAVTVLIFDQEIRANLERGVERDKEEKRERAPARDRKMVLLAQMGFRWRLHLAFCDHWLALPLSGIILGRGGSHSWTNN